MIAYASMYGNTETAAQALATKLVERGITNVSLFDVSNTHVSYLIAEAFRVSHIVLASVTYNLEIYPVMKAFLDDMKALNLQRRSVAVIENGSWAVKSGDKISEFVDNEMKMMNLIGDRVTVNSSLTKENEADLDALADAIVEDMNR